MRGVTLREVSWVAGLMPLQAERCAPEIAEV